MSQKNRPYYYDYDDIALHAQNAWKNSSDLKKITAMAAFGQIIKTSASIAADTFMGGGGGSASDITHNDSYFYYKGVGNSISSSSRGYYSDGDDDESSSPSKIITATHSLLELEKNYKSMLSS